MKSLYCGFSICGINSGSDEKNYYALIKNKLLKEEAYLFDILFCLEGDDNEID